MTLFVKVMRLFDSVSFGISNDYTFDEEQKLLDKLEKLEVRTVPATGFRASSGYLNGVKIGITADRIFVSCSLPKLIRGDNMNLLTPQEMNNVYNQFAELLSLPSLSVKKAILLSVDVTGDMEMQYHPSAYFNEMGQHPRMRRELNKTSLYYLNRSSKLLFYDKILEAVSRKYQIPEHWRKKQILRYERRVSRSTLKRICGEIGIGPPLLNTLEDFNLYLKLVDKWKEGYEKILKKTSPVLNPIDILLPKDLERYFRVCGIEYLGGIDNVLNIISQRFKMDPPPRGEYKSRMQRSVRNLIKNSSFSQLNPLIEELDLQIARKALELTYYIK